MENGCTFGTISARCMPLVLIESSKDFEQLLFYKFILVYIQKLEPRTILNLQFSHMAAILKNGCIFRTIDDKCLLKVMIESSDDFEQLLFWAFIF